MSAYPVKPKPSRHGTRHSWCAGAADIIMESPYGFLVDISNLVSEESLQFVMEEPCRTRSNQCRSDRENDDPFYPSPRRVEAIPEIDMDKVLAKSRIFRRVQSVAHDLHNGQSAMEKKMSMYGMGSSRLDLSKSSNNSSRTFSRGDSFRYASDHHDNFQSRGHNYQQENEYSAGYASPRDVTAHPNKMQPQSAALEVEISPGVYARLRGSQETWRAVEEGNVEESECFCCGTQLLCIADADYVLCPECKVVSPITTNINRKLSPHSNAGGVGLGLRATQNC